MRKHIPNLITSLNLLSGMGGIVLVMNGNTAWASVMIIIAGIFDFFDGMLARWLKVQSPGGRELDSLADEVSFGVLPGLILLKLYQFYVVDLSGLFWILTGWLFLLFPIFSAWRLARFNVDARQAYNFRGLPTPAASLLVASIDAPGGLTTVTGHWVVHPLALVFLGLALGLLMVSEIPFFGLKIHRFSLHEYPVQASFLAISLIFIVLLGLAGMGLSMILYLLVNLIAAVFNRKL